jgi:hypothetical protein
MMGFSIRLFFPTGILVRLFGLFLFQKFQAIPLIGEAGKLLILVKTVTPVKMKEKLLIILNKDT